MIIQITDTELINRMNRFKRLKILSRYAVLVYFDNGFILYFKTQPVYFYIDRKHYIKKSFPINKNRRNILRKLIKREILDVLKIAKTSAIYHLYY